MKTIHLTLKRQWFDMILSGEKKEEYREIKPYWISRLTELNNWTFSNHNIEEITEHLTYQGSHQVLDFDTITFKNGYASDAPEMVVECRHITVDEGHIDWGAEPGTKYFVISLGEILSTKNIKN